MKRIFLSVLSLAFFAGITLTAGAQKTKIKDDNTKEKEKSSSREVIILKDGEKDTKLTIETKNGEVFINGKPASEYKDDNVTVIPGKDGHGNFIFSPKGNMHVFNDGDWNEKGEKKAYLGVNTEKADNGVRITSVEDGSAAEKAGLKEGDVITKLGDKKIEEPGDLSDAVISHKPKDEVNVTYERDGKSNSTKAALGEQSGWGAFSFNSAGSAFKMNNDLLKEFNYSKDFNKSFSYTMPPMKIEGNGQNYRYFVGGGKRLGLKVEDTDDDNGAKVTGVEKESAAEKAGLKEGDIITEIGGKKVKNVNDVIKEVRETNDKNSYNVKAKRNGSEMNFEVKIPKKKNNADI